MNRPEIYKKSTDALFQAYYNDTLQHGNCYACACGNIIADANGYSFIKCIDRGKDDLAWDVAGGRYYGNRYGAWYNYFSGSTDYEEEAKKQIAETGYSIIEFKQIERAFEKAPRGNSKEDRMFNGLVAVLEVLKVIHEVEDNEPEVTRFRNHYKTLVNVQLVLPPSRQ